MRVKLPWNLLAATLGFVATALPGGAVTRYVAPDGLHTPPFTNWVDAATNLVDVVEVAQDGDLILVTNGYYRFIRTIAVQHGVEIRSMHGAAFTTLDGSETNASVSLDHPQAIFDGFTVTRCRSFAGGGIYLSGGAEVLHCVVTNNRAYLAGGGIHCNLDSAVRDTLIRDNEVVGDGDGGGIYVMRGGLVENCVIVSNRARVGGGVVLAFQSTLLNCQVSGNSARQAGGVLASQGGRLLNSTVADNTAEAAGGVDLFLGGELINTIVYHNAATRGSNYVLHASADNAPVIRFSATAPAAAGAGNTAADPLFKDRAAGNYRLQTTSPCIDAGTEDGAPATDIDGLPRPVDGNGDSAAQTDMGAYEFAP